MGWLTDEHPGHEGYLVGVVPAGPAHDPERHWRELSYRAGDEQERSLHTVHMGCS